MNMDVQDVQDDFSLVIDLLVKCGATIILYILYIHVRFDACDELRLEILNHLFLRALDQSPETPLQRGFCELMLL